MPEPRKKSDAGIPAELYLNVFQGNPDGQKILDELAQLFHDRVLSSMDSQAALYSEGQRSVVLYIIRKCAEGQK